MCAMGLMQEIKAYYWYIHPEITTWVTRISRTGPCRFSGPENRRDPEHQYWKPKERKMTDLEAYVSQPGREDLVKQVREKINELNVTYIYYQFISVTGRIVGKGIPADHWERTAAVSYTHLKLPTIYSV